MSLSTLPSIADRAVAFLAFVKAAIQYDTGSKAVLKRALTGEAHHIRAVYPIILDFLERQGIKYHQNEWIFVACLFAYYEQPINKSDNRNFGHSARELSKDGSSRGPDRRFRAVLDTNLEDLRSPLSALVRLMKSKHISIHYPQLIADLEHWDHPDQYIQDRWARAFWGAPLPQPPPPLDEQ